MTDVEKAREALGLHHSMALGGEAPSAISEKAFRDGWEALDRVAAMNDALKKDLGYLNTRNHELLDKIDHLAARVGEAKESVRWRHKVRGTIYDEIGEGQLQTREYIGGDTYLVLYRGEDGKLWARPMGEFHDGRFERVVTLPPPPATS